VKLMPLTHLLPDEGTEAEPDELDVVFAGGGTNEWLDLPRIVEQELLTIAGGDEEIKETGRQSMGLPQGFFFVQRYTRVVLAYQARGPWNAARRNL